MRGNKIYIERKLASSWGFDVGFCLKPRPENCKIGCYWMYNDISDNSLVSICLLWPCLVNTLDYLR